MVWRKENEDHKIHGRKIYAIMVSELADQAGFSLFHYYRLFQQSTGLPGMQYILRRRLLHGIYAIKQGSSMIDASLCYGFDTYAGFYKAFCREFGATPSAFLESGRVRRPYPLDWFCFHGTGVPWPPICRAAADPCGEMRS